jgi:phospholipase C
MDGFIRQGDAAKASCKVFDDPACSVKGLPDVMGYHTGAEIPNYWEYARNYALDHHMFEPVKSGRCLTICTWCRPGRPGVRTARP